MIKTKKELEEYLSCDSKNYSKRVSGFLLRFKNNLATNPINDQQQIWKYIKELRINEYHLNNSFLVKNVKKSLLEGVIHTILLIISNYRLKKLSYKTGFQIPPNTIGKGLTIFHYGFIIVNGKTRIGDNCIIYPGVEIGHKKREEPAPIIGDNCFIGAGVKIFVAIRVGNNVTIAANAVVVKDIPDNCIVGGVPANIIKRKGE